MNIETEMQLKQEFDQDVRPLLVIVTIEAVAFALSLLAGYLADYEIPSYIGGPTVALIVIFNIGILGVLMARNARLMRDLENARERDGRDAR